MRSLLNFLTEKLEYLSIKICACYYFASENVYSSIYLKKDYECDHVNFEIDINVYQNIWHTMTYYDIL
jgi:hypothetical protein